MFITMKSIWTLLILLSISFSGAAQGKQVIGLINQIPLEQYVHKTLFLPKATSIHPEVNAPSLLKQFDVCELQPVNLQWIVANKPSALSIQVPIDGQYKTLHLMQNPLLHDDFAVNTKSGDGRNPIPFDYSYGAYYLGVVDQMPESVVAISFFNNDIQGLICTVNGNYVLGKTNIHADDFSEFIVYNDKDLTIENPFHCGTTEAMKQSLSSSNVTTETITTKCVKIYFECDYAFYQDHSSNVTTATNFATSLYNQVATLYLNDSVSTGIASISVWTTTDPYASFMNTGDMLDEFSNQMSNNGFTGDLAHLLSSKSAGGGIAWLDVLCEIDYYRTGVSASLDNTLTALPTWSWNANVATHELGHNIASPHTHACAWNGNNTRIDNCAGNYNIIYQEGNCNSYPADPSAGGTIMSYCHLRPVGVNLSLGFGPQPGALIRSRVNNATCLTPCVTCPSSITITGAYSTTLAESTSWIKSSGQTTISSSNIVKLDASPTAGYVLFAPASATDYLVSQPTTGGAFIAQALDGCAGSTPQRPSGFTEENNINSHSFIVFPNPTNDELFIRNERVQGEQVSITVLGLDGKVIMNKEAQAFYTEQAISLHSLQKGLYFIRITRNGESETVKIQKL